MFQQAGPARPDYTDTDAVSDESGGQLDEWRFAGYLARHELDEDGDLLSRVPPVRTAAALPQLVAAPVRRATLTDNLAGGSLDFSDVERKFAAAAPEEDLPRAPALAAMTNSQIDAILDSLDSPLPTEIKQGPKPCGGPEPMCQDGAGLCRAGSARDLQLLKGSVRDTAKAVRDIRDDIQMLSAQMTLHHQNVNALTGVLAAVRQLLQELCSPDARPSQLNP